MKQATKAFNLGLVALVCFFFANGFANADTIYVSNGGDGTIGSGVITKFDSSSGQGSVFATGLTNPQGLAFDNNGSLYVGTDGGGGSQYKSQIRKFDSNGAHSYFTDLGYHAYGLGFSDGYFYSVDGSGIEKITTTGVRSQFADPWGDWPNGLAIDSVGNIYVGDNLNLEISKFTPSGSRSVLSHTIGSPYGLAFDSADNLYAAEYYNNLIEKITPSGVASVFADASDGLNGPFGLAFDSAGNLYVGNRANDTLMKFTPDGAGSVFATTDLNNISFIAIQVPEPATWSLLVLGALTLLGGCRRRRRS